MSHTVYRAFKGVGLLMLCFALLSACASSEKAQDRSSQQQQRPEQSENGMKPYSEVITDEAESDEGLFDVHKVDTDYYYEIPDSLLSREMLLVSRIAETQRNIGYGGEKLNTQVVRWQKKDDSILLRHVSYENVAQDSLPVYEAVQNSNFEPIIASFDIKSLGEDSSGVVIDVTDLYSTDVQALGLQDYQRQEYQVRALDRERSFIERISSYPKNIEARSWMTYQASNPPSNATTGTISMEINHSMVLLPAEKMDTRPYDQRVGYFSIQKTDYGADAHKAKEVQYVTRYKLVPKDKEAYLDGELVEPENPIVYYIDPATPKKWRPYLKQGVEDWNKAFRAAGFKNAIVAKDPPTEAENPDWSPEDVRYSVIRYFASDVQNAYGPHVHDPRTGQILESDIGWYHNVMNLLRNWYFVQTAAVNPEARSVQFEDEVMGELIRFVSAHEVGHTLGLPHNFGSSHATPVDSLRSPTFTDTHGTAPSIMDYARFNYIAQPGDGVTNFHPRVGEYDKWAVKWGYTWFGDMPIEEQRETLNEWIVERADDPRYFYGRQTSSKIDPRSQNEDLGDDAMRASEYGLANLQVITDNLIDWVEEDGENFSHLQELYNNVIGQWGRYMGHVASNIAGVYENHKTFEQEGAVYSPVSVEEQRRAMDFLSTHAFTAPSWAYNEDILSRINQADFIDTFRGAQVRVLNNILDPQRLARLIEYEIRSDNSYSPYEFMDDVQGSIWTELSDGSDINVYRRNLQRAHIERLEELMTEELPSIPAQFRQFLGWTQVNVSQSDIRPMVREQLENIQEEAVRAAARTNDRATAVHLRDVDRRIGEILDPS